MQHRNKMTSENLHLVTSNFESQQAKLILLFDDVKCIESLLTVVKKLVESSIHLQNLFNQYGTCYSITNIVTSVCVVNLVTSQIVTSLHFF